MIADRVLAEIRDQGLLAARQPVVVLYSGGRDSTCLLDLAALIAGPAAVTALHVNYGMRPQAAADERHCAAQCQRLGLSLEVRRPRRAQADAGNLQAWARDQRYREATALAGELGAHIAAGHTATDQVETILYRLASSPSRRALLGMRARDGLVIRPLLSVTRAQTADYCRERALSWREDESNDFDAYARNRIRRRVVPALDAVHPAAQANVLAVAAILREEGEVLDELVDAVLGERGEIALGELRRLAPALRRLVVQRLADASAGAPAAGVGRRAEEVAGMSDRGTTALDLPHGLRATAVDGVVRFGPTPHAGRGRGATTP